MGHSTFESFEILVCKGPECAGKGDADAVYQRLCTVLEEQRMSEQVRVGRKNCFGRCRRGPNVYVRRLGVRVHPHQDGPRPRISVLYNRVAVQDADAIVIQHLAGGHVLEHLIEGAPDPGPDRSENA